MRANFVYLTFHSKMYVKKEIDEICDDKWRILVCPYGRTF